MALQTFILISSHVHVVEHSKYHKMELIPYSLMMMKPLKLPHQQSFKPYTYFLCYLLHANAFTDKGKFSFVQETMLANTKPFPSSSKALFLILTNMAQSWSSILIT
jgi:hypothetical protein